MGSTSGDVGSRVGKISILLLGCHYADYELRGHFPLIFLPHACIVIILGNIMGDRGNFVVGSIIGVIFLLLPH